ncbi:MAG: hypothetical protein R3281_16020, partial [Balneolaceae bacterium]|nr:hypothetical protein [Balneolaceae bacterium]
MDWDALLLLIIGAYLTARTGQLAYRLESLKHLCYTVSVLFFALGQGGIITETVLAGNEVAVDLSMYVELASYISISLLLCGLALLIRESKPVFAQFPLIYAGAPLLLIFSYWLVRNSFAIKEWLLSIYQGGAILVALLMFG